MSKSKANTPALLPAGVHTDACVEEARKEGYWRGYDEAAHVYYQEGWSEGQAAALKLLDRMSSNAYDKGHTDGHVAGFERGEYVGRAEALCTCDVGSDDDVRTHDADCPLYKEVVDSEAA